MAVTRIKSNQLTDGAVTAAKIGSNAVTAAKLEDNLTYGSNLTVTGNLTVNGTTSQVNSTTMSVDDPVLLLSEGQSGAPSTDIGFMGERGDEANVAFVWDESADEFVAVTTSNSDTNTTLTITDYADMRVGGLTADDNATIGGTLGVTGNTTLSGTLSAGNTSVGTLDASGLASLDGGIDVDGAFTVANTSGNVSTSGTLSAGNTSVGTLDASGLASLDGGIDVDGAFTVANTSGNVVAGGTLAVTGATTLTGALTANGAVTLGNASADAIAITGTATFAESADFDGGWTVAATQTLDAGANKITNVADCTSAQDAATKAYVDSQISAGWTLSDGSTTQTVAGGDTVTLAGTANEINVAVSATDTMTIGLPDSVSITTNLSVGGNGTVTGTLSAGNTSVGTLDASGLASLDGGIDVDGAFTVANTSGNINTSGTLSVDGNSTLGGTLAVTGATTVTGALNANGGIACDTNKFTVADTTGNTAIAGTLAVTGAQTFTGATTMSGNASVGGTLTVTGATTLSDNLTVDGNLTVNGTTTTVNSTTVSIDDPIFNLGGDTAPSSDDNLDRGIIYNYHNGTTAKKGFFGMDDSASEFIYIADATDTASVISGSLGNAAFGSLRVTDLTNTRVLLAGASGEIEDSGNLTFNGTTLALTGAQTISSTLDVTGNTSLDGNATVGGTLAVTGATTLSSTLSAGASTLSSATITGNATVGGTLGVTGATGIDGDFDINTNKFTVASASGNTAVAGTLSVTGASTLTGATTVAGLLNANGGIAVDTNNFTVSGADGSVVTAGTLDVAGLASLDGGIDVDGAFTVANTSGNVATTGTLSAGNTSVGTLDASGLASLDGGIDVDGAFTVANTSGNVATTGTLSAAATSVSTLDASGLASLDGGIDVDGAFTVANTSGNVATTGTLSAGNTSVGTLDASGLASLDGGIDVDGAFTVANTSGNIATSGTLSVTGATASLDAAVTINESGNDVDFRVEGNTNANVLVVDAGNDSVNIGGATTTAGVSLKVDTTDSFMMAAGTTAQRPGTPVARMMRWNTTSTAFEYYDGSDWKNLTADFTVIASQAFDGDDTTTAFTLSEAQTTASCIVSINGVVQLPTTAYGVSGTTLTFTEAPATGDKIEVRKLTTTTTVTGLDDGASNSTIDCNADGTIDVTGNVTVTGNLHATGNITADGNLTLGDAATDTVTLNADMASDIIPDANNTRDLGSASAKWAEVHATTFTGALTGDVTGNADTATALATARSIALGGDVSGSANFDGSANVTITATVADDSHNHVISNVDGLQAALDAKAALAGATFTGDVAGTNLTLSGNLTVNGTTTTVNSTNLAVSDAVIQCASGNSSASASYIGIQAERGGTDAYMVWEESSDRWRATTSTDGSTHTNADMQCATLYGTSTTAQYADLAEKYATDADIEVGTVVCFGGDAEVTTCMTDADRRVAGVISTDPAYMMNSEAEGQYVALTGRVPCKVIGPVQKGDMMVSAGNGMARAEADPKLGSVIGKALEDFDGVEGVIEVVVGRM